MGLQYEFILPAALGWIICISLYYATAKYYVLSTDHVSALQPTILRIWAGVSSAQCPVNSSHSRDSWNYISTTPWFWATKEYESMQAPICQRGHNIPNNCYSGYVVAWLCVGYRGVGLCSSSMEIPQNLGREIVYTKWIIITITSEPRHQFTTCTHTMPLFPFRVGLLQLSRVVVRNPSIPMFRLACIL